LRTARRGIPRPLVYAGWPAGCGRRGSGVKKRSETFLRIKWRRVRVVEDSRPSEEPSGGPAGQPVTLRRCGAFNTFTAASSKSEVVVFPRPWTAAALSFLGVLGVLPLGEWGGAHAAAPRGKHFSPSRLSGITRLKKPWEDVDIFSKRIVFRESKLGSFRILPVVDEYTPECLQLKAGRPLRGGNVCRCLSEL
jgi:hypothetical protein